MRRCGPDLFGQGPPAAPRPSTDTNPVGSSLPIEAQCAVSAAIGHNDSRYHALSTAAGVVLGNPAQGLRVVFGHDGTMLQAGLLVWQMGLASWGYSDACGSVERGAPVASGNRVEVDHSEMTEPYVNGPFGLQQGFIVTAAPGERDDAPLVLRLAAPEGWAARIDPDGRALAWCRNSLVSFSARGPRQKRERSSLSLASCPSRSPTKVGHPAWEPARELLDSRPRDALGRS